VETIGSKRSYALIWCMPNNDDDDDLATGSVIHKFNQNATVAHVLVNSMDLVDGNGLRMAGYWNDKLIL